MLLRSTKTDFSKLKILMAIAIVFLFVSVSVGRSGVKLYSIGTNSTWTSAGTWSLSATGAGAGLLPQSNDTLVIQGTVVQNIDFAFSGNGCLEVSKTGLLRGDNFELSFSGNAGLNCNGEIRVNNLYLLGNASCIISDNGKISVKNSVVNNSLNTQSIAGRLTVSGTLSVDSQVNISGKGIIESARYSGNGSVFGIKTASSVPDGSLITEFNWVGSLNVNWNEPLNWAGGILPGENSNVAILNSNNNPDITDKAYVSNLYINSGSRLSVNPAAVMDVKGNLSVIGVGTLLLKNTATSKSSLILNGTVSGKIKAEYPVVADKKNLITSPVSAASSMTFINMYLRTYDESASQWGEYIIPTNDQLKVMQGYELLSLKTETRTFEGTPNTDSKSISISNSGDGLNLTGNPFTSYIDWDNNDNISWQRNTIASAIYYPDPSGSGNFSIYLPGGEDAVSINNGSRYIAPMQGFFVKAASNGSLTVSGKSRVGKFSDSKIVLKNNSIKLKLNDSQGLTDEVLFRVNPNATYGFDDELDAIKLKGNDDSPALYMKSEADVKYAVNTIPSVNSLNNIPLVVEFSKAGMFTLSAKGSRNFEYSCPVVLEDRQLNTFIDLRSDSVYTFYHTPEMNPERFVIHFSSPTGIEEQEQQIVSETIVNPGEVTVTGKENIVYTAKLYTCEGRLISSAKGILSEGINLSTGKYSAGVCLLQLTNGKHSTTKKIITK
jgi:hypothetical protein